jgi:hypothetical protein
MAVDERRNAAREEQRRNAMRSGLSLNPTYKENYEELLASYARRFVGSAMSRRQIKRQFDAYQKLGAFDYAHENGTWKVILKSPSKPH